MSTIVKYSDDSTYTLVPKKIDTEVVQNVFPSHIPLTNLNRAIRAGLGFVSMTITGDILSKTACRWHDIQAISLDLGVSWQTVYFTSISFVSDCWSGIYPYTLVMLASPLREGVEERTDLALWVSSFSFPLELIAAGIEMGHRELSVIVNVFNDGGVPCGMRVVFTALATLTNPSILSLDTQEFIKINKTMTAGETITVTTDFGNKKVESAVGGVTTNAFNYIDFGSTFFQLAVGDNLIRYDADTGIDNLVISIYYTPQDVGT